MQEEREPLTESPHVLLARHERGESARCLAEEMGCSKSRMVRLLRKAREERTPARVQALAENAGEVMTTTLDALGLLQGNVRDLERLRDACLKLLRDPDDEDGLDVSPHVGDVEVVVPSEDGPPVRRKLSALLSEVDSLVFSVQVSTADPRTLLLSTIAQLKQHIELGLKLAERLYTVQEVERFQKDVLEVVESVDEEAGREIRRRLLERKALRLAVGRPGIGG